MPPYLRWLETSTVKHLRFPFSFFLLPVFLFALSQANDIHWGNTILAFLILHILIFPSSNGYNSYQDKDETSIGGLKHPPKVTKNLYYVTLAFDAIGVLTSLIISIYFSLFVFVFILMSRAYSYRKIRLKKYAVLGFLTVFIFQGGFFYLMSASAISTLSPMKLLTQNNLICMILSSLFLGSAYPLTQIYQHEADKNDGVISLSYKLGYKGTFIFSSILFAMASILLFYYLTMNHLQVEIFLFVLFVFPVVLTLTAWFNKVRRNTENANFENTMRMNIINSCCMNLYFSVLVLNHLMSWFK